MCLPSALTVPGVAKADLDQDGNTKDERLLKNVTKVCNEMKWYADALAKQRDSSDGGYPN